MNTNKPENRKVRKFLLRLGVFVLLVSGVVAVYMLADDKDVEMNPAEEVAIDMREDLNRKIDVHVEEIDEWVKLLGSQQKKMSRDHSEHITQMLAIKDELVEAKRHLSNEDTNLKSIKENVDYLVGKFESESQSISFSETMDVD